MGIKIGYKPPRTDSGSLRTPVVFYEMQPNTGPEPGEMVKTTLFECFAEIYNPSMKDLEIMDKVGSKEAITLKIRDPGKDYIPVTAHCLEVKDYRYVDKVFNLIDVAYDLADNRFIKLIGAYTT